MARNIFEDPKTEKKYSWAVNHTEEDEAGKSRNVESSANTENTGLNPQQADDQPLIFRFNGTIFSKAQVEEMIAWYNLCSSQTIYFTDFAEEEYEVLITSFKPKRKYTIRNPRDFANAPLWYWSYTMEIRVIRSISSIWDAVTI